MLEPAELERLEAQTKSRGWEERREAVRRLAEAKDPRALPLVRRMLDDPNSEVGVCAVMALGSIGSPEALPDLRRELGDLFRNRRRRREALLGMGRIRDESVIPDLAIVLEGQDHYVKDAAIAALSQFGEQALPVLKEQLRNQSDIALRLLLAFALAQQGDNSGVAVFVDVLNDHVRQPDRWDPKAIAATVVATGEHRLRGALPPLRQMRRDLRFERAFPGLVRRAMEAISKDAGGSLADYSEDPEFADTGSNPPLPTPEKIAQDTRSLATEDTAEVRLAGVPSSAPDDGEGPALVAGDLRVDEDADTPLPGMPAAADDGDTGADPGTRDVDTEADPEDDDDEDEGDATGGAVAADDGKA